jgi:hypothetical protein
MEQFTTASSQTLYIPLMISISSVTIAVENTYNNPDTLRTGNLNI